MYADGTAAAGPVADFFTIGEPIIPEVTIPGKELIFAVEIELVQFSTTPFVPPEPPPPSQNVILDIKAIVLAGANISTVGPGPTIVVLDTKAVTLAAADINTAAATAATWFVDNAASGTNSGTSMANAWTSFAAINWGSVQPGHIIDVSGGSTSKTYNAALVVGASGTAGNPITIRRSTISGHTGTPIIDGQQTRAIGVDLGGRSHVIFQGFDVRNHTTSGIDCDGSGGVGVIVQNNTVLCGNTTGAPRGIDFRSCSGFTIRNNTITTPGSVNGQTDCIVINEVDNFMVEGNFCRVDNVIDVGHSDAFQFWDVDSGTIRNNTFISSTAGSNNHPAMLEAVHDGEVVNFYNNVCWSRGGQTNVQYFRDISLPTTPGHGRMNFWNNTFYGGSAVFNLDNTSNIELRNNIIVANASVTPILFQGSAGDPTPGNVTGNLVWRPSGTTIATTVALGNRTWAQWLAAGFNAGGVNVDPLFINSATGDFNLQETSDAIDAGTTIATVTTDIIGVTRPQGAAYDIGAFEVVQGGTGTVTWAGTVLTWAGQTVTWGA